MLSRLQALIHGPHATQRQAYIDALASLLLPSQRKKAHKMLCCSMSGQYIMPDTRPAYVRLDRCGRRLCPLCSRLRASRVRRRLIDMFAGQRDLRHIVLTVPHGKEVLREQVANLLTAFGRFRCHPDWKVHVRGGVYCLEVSRKPDADSWHVHLHVVVSGMYWRQRELAITWSEVVGEDSVVWICRAGDRHASYLAKYIGSPDKLHLSGPALIREYDEAISSRRLVQAFGEWHGLVSDGDKATPKAGPAECVQLDRLVILADRGHVGARRLLHLLSARYPYLRSADWMPPDIPLGATDASPESDLDEELVRLRYVVSEITSDYTPQEWRRKDAGKNLAMS